MLKCDNYSLISFYGHNSSTCFYVCLIRLHFNSINKQPLRNKQVKKKIGFVFVLYTTIKSYDELNSINFKLQDPPCTAIQSFMSSPGGSLTTSFKSIPEFNEALACLCRLNFMVPGSNLFLGRKV